MIKRAPSRNQRTKGIKVKHVLQICLLLGVCFWLIYQVKHSHDKKVALDKKDKKTSTRSLSEGELLKLGRKDLPKLEVPKNEKQEEEDEVEAAGEEHEKHQVDVHEEEDPKHEVEAHEEEDQKHEGEEREEEDQKHEVGEQEEEDPKGKQEEEDLKHEAEEQEEEENKNEETEDEGRGAGDDEIDENEQEGNEGEVEHDEDFVDEEKEREDDGNEKDGEKNDGEEREDQEEHDSSSDDQDNETHDKNAHEAREENYKGDDASSAVAHEVTSTETEKVSSENLNENPETTVLEKDNSTMVEDRMAENGTILNVGASEEKANGNMANPAESSLLHEKVKTQSNDEPEAWNNSTMVSAEANDNSTIVSTEASNNPTETNQASGSYQQNGTEIVSESAHSENATVDGMGTGESVTILTMVMEQANNTASQNNESDSNSTISTKIENADGALGESSSFSNTVATNVSENILRSDGTAETEGGSRSSSLKEATDAVQNEESNGTSESDRTDEGSDSTNGTQDATQRDPIDSSDSHITQDKKEDLTDLTTLPEITTEGDENGEAAAE
ncbi:hypothetical protein FF2_003360 [Malus domestica]